MGNLRRSTNLRTITRNARIRPRIASPARRLNRLILPRLKASSILTLRLSTKAPATLSSRRILLITLNPVTRLLKLLIVPLILCTYTLPRNLTHRPTTRLQATSRRLTMGTVTPRRTSPLQGHRNPLKNIRRVQ